MNSFFLWTVLCLSTTDIFVVETAQIRDNRNPLHVISRIKKEVVNDNPCNRIVIRRQPRWRKGLRMSDMQCDLLINDMFYRDEEERNKMKCIESRGDDTIYLGQNATPFEFPHMAALGYKNRYNDSWVFNCGGSLISSKYVLTAAHCVVDSGRGNPADHIDALPTIVGLGQIDITELRVDINISNILRHPNFKYPKRYYDIALLELEKEVHFSKHIQPACLWTQRSNTLLGRKAIITGWGDRGTNANNLSTVLQAATIDILDSNECENLLEGLISNRWSGFQDDQICAGTLAGGADTCAGDSGGPLQVKIPVPLKTQGTISYVIGVTSFGSGCGFRDRPGVYSSVYAVLDWIESVVWPVL